MRGSGGYPLLRFYKKPTLPDWLRRGDAGNLTRTSPRLSASLLTTHHDEGLDKTELEPKYSWNLPAVVAELIGERFFLIPSGRSRATGARRPSGTAPRPAGAAARRHCASIGFSTITAPRTVALSGLAGEILVFDADLLHAASLSPTGAHRRSSTL